MRFLCIGNLACDVIVKPLDKATVQGRTLLKDVSLFAGGDALNAAIDLATLGQKTCLIGRIGKDDFGAKIRSELTRHPSIDIRHLKELEEIPTSTSVSTIMPDGERYAGYRAGANETLSLTDVPEEAIREADHVHLGIAMRLNAMDGEGTCRLFQKAKELGKTTSMDLVVDLDGVWMRKIRDTLSHCDIFIPSDYEVREVCGLTDPLAMKEFFQPFGLSVFGVKMGAKGVFVTDYRQDIFMPSVAAKPPVDTLGAGDAFMATFIAAYKNQLPLEIAVAMASYASSFVIDEYGPTTGMREYEFLRHKALQHLEKLGSGPAAIR